MDETSLVKLGMGLMEEISLIVGTLLGKRENCGNTEICDSSSFAWLKALLCRWRLIGISVFCPHLCYVVLL